MSNMSNAAVTIKKYKSTSFILDETKNKYIPHKSSPEHSLIKSLYLGLGAVPEWGGGGGF